MWPTDRPSGKGSRPSPDVCNSSACVFAPGCGLGPEYELSKHLLNELNSSEQQRNGTSIISYLNGIFLFLIMCSVQGESDREKKSALCDRTDMCRLVCEQPLHQRETEALRLQLQEREDQVLQVCGTCLLHPYLPRAARSAEHEIFI